MKYLFITTMFLSTLVYGQLTIDSLKKIVAPLRLGYSNYFEPFVNKVGYGGPWILNKDGGGAAFGDNTLYKFDKKGKELWKRKIKDRFEEMESQVVADDTKGNLYVFMLEYNSKVYRGGNERVVCFDKTGKQLWDKNLGAYSALNNPIVSYVKTTEDGKIYMRGHMAKEKPKDGDPKYLFWEGWLDVTGKLTQKTGEQIDWAKDEWQKKFKPE